MMHIMQARGTTQAAREKLLPARAATRPPGHHFFGYYDKLQFDSSGRFLLGLRCAFADRLQRPGDEAVVGIINLAEDNRWEPVASSSAWNWQMGCMLQWIPGSEKLVVFNDRRGGRLVSVILDIESGKERTLPQPVFAVHPEGKTALTLDFERLWRARPETGYCGGSGTASFGLPHGGEVILRMDMETGKSEPIITFQDIPGPRIQDTENSYFTHILFNASGSRFSFWLRRSGQLQAGSAVYTADSSGGSIFKITDNNSHCAWLGDDKLLAWANPGRALNAPAYLLFDDKTGRFEEIAGAGFPAANGHFSFSPDKRWLLTDTPPDAKNLRHLLLYDLARGRCLRIGGYYSPPEFLRGPCRCDLHPRWDRTGRKICFDSAHEGTRQMYIVDASSALATGD